MYPNPTGPMTSRPVTRTARAAAQQLPPVAPVRMLLLTAILYNPPILIGYLLYLYGPSKTCVAGPICQFGSFPGYLQIVLLLAGAWLLWLLMAVGVRRLLEWPGWQGRIARALRAISEYESVREFMGVLGVLLVICMVFALLSHHLTPTALIVGAFTAGVAIRAALVRDDPALAASQPAPQAPAAAPRAPIAGSLPQVRSVPFSAPQVPAPSAPYTTPEPPPLPPEFLPPQESLMPPVTGGSLDATRPTRWEGQSV